MSSHVSTAGRIAILDFVNQDPGLKVLFPDADYYVFKTEDFTIEHRRELYARRGLGSSSGGADAHMTAIENITDKNYDTLFVVGALYNSCETWSAKKNTHFNAEIRDFFFIMIDIIKSNRFARVFIFDNYDYDYDPNTIFVENGVYEIVEEKNIHFFKRFYSREKIYRDNVFSFPYIMFGFKCNIDIITGAAIPTPSAATEDRLFFAGAVTSHKDDVYGVERNRAQIMREIHERIGNYLVVRNRLSADAYMSELRASRFCLDLHGVGEPNKRTFEILASGSLRIAQRSSLEWNFDDDFAEETYFSTADELFEKMKRLILDPELYNRCLQKQNEIVRTHMTVDAIRNYVSEIITEV